MFDLVGKSSKFDFENAIWGQDVGVLFFDENLNVRRITPIAMNSGFWSKDDLGKNIDELACITTYRTFAKDVHKAFSKGGQIYKEVLGNGSAWIFRVRPYYASDNKVTGVTVVIVDITRTKTMETRAQSMMKNVSVAAIEALYCPEQGMEFLNFTDSVSRLMGYTEKEFNAMLKGRGRLLYLQETYNQFVALADAVYRGQENQYSQIRIRTAQGDIKWVEIRCEYVGKTAHRFLVQFLAIDVTAIFTEREKLRLEKRKLSYIIEITGDTLFEYNPSTDTMTLTRHENNGEVEATVKDFIVKLRAGTVTPIEDDDVVQAFCDDIENGKREIKAIFRNRLGDFQYHWMKIDGKSIYSSTGKLTRIIGRIANVDDEKNREAELIKNSEMDSLTGLYNHQVTIDRIKKQMAKLKGDDKGYLVVIDVDDFKRINDENGHLYGDASLCSLSDAMKANFPMGIKGRIGGDEFMLFVKNIEQEDLKHRLSNILSEFRKIGEDKPGNASLSCSMGVAIVDKNNKDYEKAFETADRALYLIKETGKNSYTICVTGDDVLEDGHRYIAEQDEKEQYIKDASLITNDDELIVFALELMNNVGSYRKGLGIIADRVCSYVGFDGMLLISSSDSAYAVTFDWTGDKSNPYEKRLYPKNQRREWGEIESMFGPNDNYIVIRGNELEKLGINGYKSILVGKLQSSAFVTQYMAYVDKTTDRSWENETELLLRLTNMLVSKVVQMQNDEHNREEIEYRVNYDALTGLPSYTKFLELTAEYLDRYAPSETKDYYLCYADYTNFSYVNDLYGYNTGDHILELTGKRLMRANKMAVHSSRITGDQFVSLCEVDKGVDPGPIIVESFAQFNDVVKLRYPLCKLTVLCGMCKVDEPDVGVSVLVDRANAARKYGKEKGESGCITYTREMWERNEDEKEVYVNINDALKNKEFEVYLQPKVSTKTGKIVGAESLVRWRRADGTLFAPDRFIPILEKNGFITLLDYYVLEATLQYLKSLIDEGIEPIPISVNFSRVHYDDPKFASSIMEYLENYDVDPGLLEAEITEYNYLHDIKSLNPAIIELQKNGVLVSIDDFGSGYSSLNILSKVTADIIKLDKLFLENMEEQEEFLMLLTEMVNKLGYKIIMEGVETKEQMDFIASTKCDMVQGYFISKPMPMDEFKKFLVEYNKTAKPWK